MQQTFNEPSFIAEQIRAYADMLELHDENTFKVRSYVNAAYKIEQDSATVWKADTVYLVNQGYSQNMATIIVAIIETGTFPSFAELRKNTPSGLVDLLKVPGLGSKKVRQLWKEAGIEDATALRAACERHEVAQIKGFGAKTEATILENIKFIDTQKGLLLLSEAWKYGEYLKKYLESLTDVSHVSFAGELGLQREVLQQIEMVVATDSPIKIHTALNTHQEWNENTSLSGPFTWRGYWIDTDIPIIVHRCSPSRFGSTSILSTSSVTYVSSRNSDGLSLSQLLHRSDFDSEQSAALALGFAHIPSPMRENEVQWDNTLSVELVETKDIIGLMHAHSTYSDGKNTLREMAEAAKLQGFQYLGITDHSQTAVYANGLSPERVILQHKEIDALNKELAPFRILKGIESDILSDGSLDYSDDILGSFDFVIASVHSRLKMSEEQATERLLSAIQNPFTTCLGHPTTRLLLRRKGFSLDWKKIFEACAKNNVAIEINANPYRLDLDWRLVRQALDAGVKIWICPDAHSVEGYEHIQWGVKMAQKAGCTKDDIVNAHPWK